MYSSNEAKTNMNSKWTWVKVLRIQLHRSYANYWTMLIFLWDHKPAHYLKSWVDSLDNEGWALVPGLLALACSCTTLKLTTEREEKNTPTTCSEALCEAHVVALLSPASPSLQLGQILWQCCQHLCQYNTAISHKSNRQTSSKTCYSDIPEK